MKSVRRLPAISLLFCLAIAIFCVAYPLYVIRPFRAQAPTELAIALVVSRHRGIVTIIAALFAAGCAGWYWRGETRKWPRIWSMVAFCVVLTMAVLARVNIYEIMFHPIDHASFTAASDMKLDKDEKVLAVKVGTMARAYPIRGLSYHHIANDVVDKLAIVATY